MAGAMADAGAIEGSIAISDFTAPPIPARPRSQAERKTKILVHGKGPLGIQRREGLLDERVGFRRPGRGGDTSPALPLH